MAARSSESVNGLASAHGRLADAPNLNRLWADLLIEELVRCGVTQFCLAPGSRSSPLAVAVLLHPAAKHLVHFDERGTAFAALGHARATGRPACWITTSGTAVANGLPAIVEASVDGVPLIALTADRPPELRRTGANQTIDQPRIFGEYVRWDFDLPAPSPEVDPAFVLTTVDQAVHRAMHPRGPVHMNAMFREPLAPEPDGQPLPPLPDRWINSRRPFTSYPSAPRLIDDVSDVAARLSSIERGLVVAGRLRSRREGVAALRLAEHLGWPLVADVNSQIRTGTSSPALCAYGDLVVASDTFQTRHAPTAVIQVGARGASKRISRVIAAARPDPLLVISDDPGRFDPDHRVTDRIQGDVVQICDAMVGSLPRNAAGDWMENWRRASESVGAMLDDRLQGDELSEPLTARLVAELLPDDHALVVGSSMPVRDVDTFARPGGPPVPILANRGASGIDGTIATAAGVARGLGRPVTVLLGDLAFLHDLNSLALLRAADQPPVTIVVINNDGGGIFHFLPIARHAEIFEPLFGTPHGMDFSSAAAQFGVEYQRPGAGQLAVSLAGAMTSGRSSIVEVVTNRRRNRQLHEELLDAAVTAVEAALEVRV